MTWAQTVFNQEQPELRNWADVSIIDHPVERGYYAVFARLLLTATGGGATGQPWAAYVRLSLGAEKDEAYGRLLVSGTGTALKASTPVSLLVVSESGGQEGRIKLIASGNGSRVIENRITVIALDEVRPPVVYGEPPTPMTDPGRWGESP
jgi:hypothetical protein